MPAVEMPRTPENDTSGVSDRSHVVVRKVAPRTVQTTPRYEWEERLFRDPRITGSTLLIAVALGRHANRDHAKPVFPATSTTARETGVTRQTVSRATASLERAGYVTEADRRAYRMEYPELAIGDQRVKAWLLTVPPS